MNDKRLVSSAVLDDEAFNALPEIVQNLAFRIERIVDDFGLFRADPKYIKLKAAAFNEKITLKNIPGMLEALEDVNFIHRYTVEGKAYAFLVLNVNRHRTKPTCPLPPGYELEKQCIGKRGVEWHAVQTDTRTNLRRSAQICADLRRSAQICADLRLIKEGRKSKSNTFTSTIHADAGASLGGTPAPRVDEAGEELTPELQAAIMKETMEVLNTTDE